MQTKVPYLPSGLLEVIMGKHSARYQAPLPAFFQICACMRDDSTLISLSLSVCVGSSCGMLLSPAPMTLSGLATKCNHIDMKCSRGRTKS